MTTFFILASSSFTAFSMFAGQGKHLANEVSRWTRNTTEPVIGSLKRANMEHLLRTVLMHHRNAADGLKGNFYVGKKSLERLYKVRLQITSFKERFPSVTLLVKQILSTSESITLVLQVSFPVSQHSRHQSPKRYLINFHNFGASS